MPFAFELFFDAQTEREVRQAWHTLAPISDSPYLIQNAVRPHVALAVVEASSATVFDGWREVISDLRAPLRLETDGFGSFPTGVSFLRFRRTASLLSLHQRVMAFCDRSLLPASPHYRPATWVPHCTLAQGFSPERIPTVASAMADLRLSCTWTITSAGIVRFPPTVLTDEEKIG